MIKNFLQLAAFVAFAFFIFRGLDWVIPAPPQKILICIEDKNGKHHCDEFK